MRLLIACALATLACSAMVVGISSCGDKVVSGLTGLDVKVSFESDLPITRLRFAGFVAQDPAFPVDDRPHVGDDRDLDPTDENLIVILPDAMGSKSVFVRVDGLDEFGMVKASAGESKLVERDKILTVVIHLGMPRVCGDGVKHMTAEQCDDGNQNPDDGCSGECVVEAGWTCEGTPSVCRSCGDGVCSVGEDHCSCREDCEGIATCGDNLCCAERDENVCSCPEDCLEDGAQTCPDTFCCPDERAAENCEPDCGNCGDSNCEAEKGEDGCTCPEDCADAGPVCGNQNCCGPTETINNCAQDCCPDAPMDGDGTCCPAESAETAPQDCCDTMAQCNDDVCCPSEFGSACPECCADMCGDDICCGSETIDNCPQDCCPSCGDFQGCTGCCSSECQGNGCDFVCDSGCSCYFDCAGNGCTANCTSGSTCTVECAESTGPCVVDCSSGPVTGDAGANPAKLPGFASCTCHGSNCQLTCPAGDVQVPCGNDVYACDFADCP